MYIGNFCTPISTIVSPEFLGAKLISETFVPLLAWAPSRVRPSSVQRLMTTQLGRRRRRHRHQTHLHSLKLLNVLLIIRQKGERRAI